MKDFFGLLLAVVLAAGAATLVIPHPSVATPMLADYSGATYSLVLLCQKNFDVMCTLCCKSRDTARTA